MSQHLYPEIEPFASDRIAVSDRHTIHVERCGNPNGQPILFIHGGPGGGCAPKHRRFFNPKHYHIILVDQRGAGKSTPTAEVVDNTTAHLIADFEHIRQSLNIDQWLLFGGSWGSTLALAYANEHPQVVSALILRGIFLGSEDEFSWILEPNGVRRIFPDVWHNIVADYLGSSVDDSCWHNIVSHFYQDITSDDPKRKQHAADVWNMFETSISLLDQDLAAVEQQRGSKVNLTTGSIECHYFYHRLFIETDKFLANLHRNIGHIPTAIVHGRYDVICPLSTAFKLKQHLPNAQLQVAPKAGHSAFEVEIAKRLVALTDSFALG